MQTQALPERSGGRRLVSIALVVALHVAAILALLAAFKPSLLIPHHSETTISVLPPTRVETPLPANPAAGAALFYSKPDEPRQPIIDEATPQATQTTPPGAAGVTPDGGGAPSLTPPMAMAYTHSTPAYPPFAARLGEEGSVRLALAIDETGRVADANVLNSSGYAVLDAAAVQWVKSHWRYRPAYNGAAPVRSSTEAIVTFRLDMR